MRELKLNKIKATGTTVGDVYFPQTKLLLPFDGTNGATTTSDLSNSNHSVTFTGNAQVSTTQSKFGGSSCYFDGAGDYLSLAGSSDWNYGTGDFTIEFWVYLASTSRQTLMIPGTDTASHLSGVGIDYNSVGTNKLGAWASSNGSSWNIINADGGGNGIGSTTVTQSAWHHIAFVRNGTSLKLYLDGAQEVSVTSSSSICNGSGTTLNFGRSAYLGGTFYMNGYMDEIRITKGVARYTAAFTPPTTAYLTSAGDVNKQILINSTADGVAIGTGGINQARIAKAWVNFDGTGTVAIRESYNISSLTDRGTGLYTLNYSSSLSSADCSGAGAAVDATGDATERNRVVTLIPNDVSSSYINTFKVPNPSEGADDCEIVTFLIFGN